MQCTTVRVLTLHVRGSIYIVGGDVGMPITNYHALTGL